MYRCRRAFSLLFLVTLLLLLACSPGLVAAGDRHRDPREREVRVRILPRRVDAVADHVGPYPELAKTFSDLLDWIEAHRWFPVDRGIGVYRDDPSRVPAAKLRASARIPVNVYGDPLPSPDEGKIGARLERSEPVLVASLLHVGPYDRVRPTISRLLFALPKLGLEVAGPEMERYLNDPETTPPARLETEVMFPVRPRGRADIGIYADWGGFPDGIEAASLCFTSAGLTVRPVLAREINDGSFARKVRALYMPGGWAAHYVRDITDEGARHLEAFVAAGGGYIGICAGSYYAAREISWNGRRWPYDLDLFPGVPEGPIARIASWPGYAMARVALLPGHPVTGSAAETRTLFYYGGPVLGPREGADVTIVGQLADSGEPVIVALEKGKGRVFLSALHLEFDLRSTRDGTDWPEKEKGFDDPESDWDLLQRAAFWVLDRKPPRDLAAR